MDSGFPFCRILAVEAFLTDASLVQSAIVLCRHTLHSMYTNMMSSAMYAHIHDTCSCFPSPLMCTWTLQSRIRIYLFISPSGKYKLSCKMELTISLGFACLASALYSFPYLVLQVAEANNHRFFFPFSSCFSLVWPNLETFSTIAW